MDGIKAELDAGREYIRRVFHPTRLLAGVAGLLLLPLRSQALRIGDLTPAAPAAAGSTPLHTLANSAPRAASLSSLPVLFCGQIPLALRFSWFLGLTVHSHEYFILSVAAIGWEVLLPFAWPG